MLCWADGYSQKQRQEKHNWILTIHFSIKFQSYVEYGNDILVEDDIVKAVSFNWVISGTAAVLVDKDNLFVNRTLKKNIFKIRTGAWETH